MFDIYIWAPMNELQVSIKETFTKRKQFFTLKVISNTLLKNHYLTSFHREVFLENLEKPW